jgi:hypothetical protein
MAGPTTAESSLRVLVESDARRIINICYGEITCEEESSQWNTQVARGGPRGQCEFLIDWAVPDRYNYNDRFWCATDAPSWYGGPIPSNLTYPSSSATSTAPYEGKFCLQKAALKALSRRGWELIEPSEAFEPHGYYDPAYNNAWTKISTHLRRSKSSNALSPCNLFVTRIIRVRTLHDFFIHLS